MRDHRNDPTTTTQARFEQVVGQPTRKVMAKRRAKSKRSKLARKRNR